MGRAVAGRPGLASNPVGSKDCVMALRKRLRFWVPRCRKEEDVVLIYAVLDNRRNPEWIRKKAVGLLRELTAKYPDKFGPQHRRRMQTNPMGQPMFGIVWAD